MRHARLASLAMLSTLIATGCSQRTAPSSSSPVAATTATAADTSTPGDTSTAADTSSSPVATSPPRTDGAPQIATEPDGNHIEYHTYGQGEPAIILIHGWATDGNYWNAQIGPLKSRYTVVTVDLAGHGASTKNRTDWSMGAYGEDVATVARLLPNKQIILVGHSMGGTVALEATGRIGPRVIGVIAVDALKSIGLPPLPQREIETRVAPFRSEFIAQTRKYVAESLFPKGADPVFVQKVAYDMSLEPPEVAVASLQALLSMDFASVLPSIHVPVLAINSDLAPTDTARIRKSLPDFAADVIPHTSHFLMMDAADRFNPALLRDIDKLVQRAGKQ